MVPRHIVEMAGDIVMRERMMRGAREDIEASLRRLADGGRAVIADWLEEQGRIDDAKAVRDGFGFLVLEDLADP
jgi:hypothetical protein